MATFRPLVLVSGVPSELPANSDITGGAYQLNTITAGSGLAGGGTVGSNVRLDVELVPNASGLYFDGSERLGIDGSAVASGNAALTVGATALASGNAALSLGETALASGNAALGVATAALPLTGGTMAGPIVISGAGPASPGLRSNADSGLYGSGYYTGIAASGVGQLLIGPDGVAVEGSGIVIATSQTPATSSSPGRAGTIAWDSNYFYICVATNTWKRSDINIW